MPSLRGYFCEKNMTIQIPNLGTAPTGAGGDTSRSATVKFNENFTNNTHAASRLVGTAAGNVMEVGAFGVGKKIADQTNLINLDSVILATGMYSGNSWSGAPFANNADTWGYLLHQNLASAGAGFYELQILADLTGALWVRTKVASTAQAWSKIYTGKNTTVDANGFIKSASPVVQLYADKIELNDEAAEQDIIFEKVDIGHYLVKGSSGFSNDGWYIEMPKDANGNVLVAVVYEQLENKDISIQTYAKKFDEETGDIVANLAKPRDIPDGRWIDIRLNEMPKLEIVMPELQSKEETEEIADESQ